MIGIIPTISALYTALPQICNFNALKMPLTLRRIAPSHG
jgi:hypothetical protein